MLDRDDAIFIFAQVKQVRYNILGVNSRISRKIFNSYWSRIIFLVLFQDSTDSESCDVEIIHLALFIWMRFVLFLFLFLLESFHCRLFLP